MKKNKIPDLDLTSTIDVLNTLSGGISEPRMMCWEDEDERMMRFKVPGVRNRQMNVEIQNGTLSVFYYIDIISQEKKIQIPQFLYCKPIPYWVDMSRIYADFGVKELLVHMPFNKMRRESEDD